MSQNKQLVLTVTSLFVWIDTEGFADIGNSVIGPKQRFSSRSLSGDVQA